ncbi:uncharacterized protein KY384_006355 [Bacidia gigantensis]|uniref:uncharacterized protein n=1 Tax=Bacidia gigantensis TaxID=2732470 RepID=UPI001D041E9F|nr:uncharacterized protein KY384_006355 [Bacidia gigantensis]KAG8528668.1 hypothetical protein KY384_006355 [Bacidia gigantensis]
MVALIAPAAFAAINFDYLIVGGGTAGLTIATRLSENANFQVGVIEAGGDHTEDPLILTPGLALSTLNNPLYDWAFETTPQVHANGRVIGHPRGKQLGGSSAINYLYWTHASRLDIDDWGKLGNKGWSWDELNPYFSKSETYNPPSADISSQTDTTFIVPSAHGTSGPVQDSFPPFFDNFYKSWEPTYKNLGLGPTGDPRGGLAIGAYSTLVSQEPKNASRSYSANAYWKPNTSRPNYHVLTNAQATKLVFDTRHKPLTATGVNFVVDGRKYTAKVKGEVIISAGSFQSPHLLELSGIGDAKLLKSHGIDVLLDNPNVGENLQEHLLVPLTYEAAEGEGTFESFRNATIAAAASEEYAVNHTGPLASNTANAYISFAQLLKANHGGNYKTPQSLDSARQRGSKGLQEVLTLEKLLSPTEASIQEVYLPGGSTPSQPYNTSVIFSTTYPNNYFTFFSVLEHPFSRGSVHITSSDPFTYPAIDPNYLSNPLDTYVVGQGLLHIQQVAQTAPFSNHLKNGGTVYQPDFYKLDESNVEDFVKSHSASEYHPMGSCSMLPRDQGGVVNERLQVYGTKNVRVVDASVFPLAVRGNLQTLVYAVAERAADFVKADAAQEK